MAITPNHIVITNPDGSTTTVDVTWEPPPAAVATTLTMTASPASPIVEGTRVSILVKVAPSVPGTVYFSAGNDIDRAIDPDPADGSIIVTHTPPRGSITYAASFVPDDASAYLPSNALPCTYLVTAAPTSPTFPDGANLVTVNATSHVLNAIDPPTTDPSQPGGRGKNDLIIVTKSSTAPRNRWGWEAECTPDGKVIWSGVNARSVPVGGFVLSGHNGGGATDSGDYVKSIPIGATVVVTKKTVVPPIDPPPANGGIVYPSREVALYKMMYSEDQPPLATTPPQVNVIRMAFGMGNPLQLVGYGCDGRSEFIKQANAMRAKGIPFVLSVGGSDGVLNLADVNGFVAGCVAIKQDLGFLDGLDWDNEKGPNVPSQIRAIENALVATFGPNFAITYTPGPIDIYLQCAVACHKAGQLTSYGQQFYDAEVSVDAAAWRITQAIEAGLPIEKISVGMMIASDAKHWTNQRCRDNMIELRRRFPGLQRAFLWEASRSGTAAWAADMGLICGAAG